MFWSYFEWPLAIGFTVHVFCKCIDIDKIWVGFIICPSVQIFKSYSPWALTHYRILFPLNILIEKISAYTIKQGDFDKKLIICFGTKLQLSVDLTVIESYNGFENYLTSL